MFELPEDWNDDERMAFLFRDFRPRDLNPLGYDEKLDFWRNLLKRYTRQRSRATFSLRSLMESFIRKNSQPVCLRKVVDSLRQEKVFLPIESESWGGWAYSWFAAGDNTDNEMLVNSEIVQDCLDELELEVKNAGFREQKVAYREVWNRCRELFENNETLFKYVISKVANVDGTSVIFPRGSNLIRPLTEHERALMALSDAGQKIEKKIAQSLQTLDNLKAEALRNKAQGNTTAAIRNLKKRKRIEKIVDRQYQTLDKLHDMEADLDNQKDLPKILDGFKLATSAMKTVNGDAENIHGIVDDLQEAAAEHREIEESISSPIGFNEDTDMSVLEDELEKLLEENEPIPCLPDVPTEPPRSEAAKSSANGGVAEKRVAYGFFE